MNFQDILSEGAKNVKLLEYKNELIAVTQICDQQLKFRHKWSNWIKIQQAEQSIHHSSSDTSTKLRIEGNNIYKSDSKTKLLDACRVYTGKSCLHRINAMLVKAKTLCIKN